MFFGKIADDESPEVLDGSSPSNLNAKKNPSKDGFFWN